MFSTSTATAPLPPEPYQLCALAGRTYQVSFQLKRGIMHLGEVSSLFIAPCTRRFSTNELNIILAELYEEVAPSPDLLGIEILTICGCLPRTRCCGRWSPLAVLTKGRFSTAWGSAGRILRNPPTSYWLPLWLGWCCIPFWVIRAASGWGLSAHRPQS